MQSNGRLRVCLRDREKEGDKPARPGIMAAVMRRECPGLDHSPRGTHDRAMAKIIGQAMNQAGIHASQRHRKVSDYLLEQIVGEGPGYQDWQAVHCPGRRLPPPGPPLSGPRRGHARRTHDA